MLKTELTVNEMKYLRKLVKSISRAHLDPAYNLTSQFLAAQKVAQLVRDSYGDFTVSLTLTLSFVALSPPHSFLAMEVVMPILETFWRGPWRKKEV